MRTTAVGVRLLHLIDAVNGRDSVVLRNLSSEYDSTALAESGGSTRLVSRWLEVSLTSGPVVLDTVTALTQNEAVVWLRGSTSRAWLTLRAAAETAAPHRLLRVGLGRGIRPPFSLTRTPALAGGALRDTIARYLDRLTAEDLFAGTLVLTDSAGSVAYNRGLADRQHDVRWTPDTQLDVASVGKLFTVIAIAQLLEQHKLQLSDTIGIFLSELPEALRKRITIQHLLEHSSGLGELGSALDSAMTRAVTVSQMLGSLGDTVLAFPPGTDVLYSNRGFIMLGAVVERVSGLPYAMYVRRHILEPLGMRHTTVMGETSVPSAQAVRYTRYPTLRSAFISGPRVEFPQSDDLAPGPHGGALSTAGDLSLLARALSTGSLVTPTTLALLLKGGPGPQRAKGFEIGGEGSGFYFGHQGGAPGANSMLRIFSNRGVSIVILSNTDNGASLAGSFLTELIH